MAEPPPLHPDLMPSLRQLVRGLELLFWSLPFALLVCVQEILAPAWESWGIMPLLLSMSLMWLGASRLKHFQPQEGVWQSAVKITEILALVMVGLAPFLHWIQTLPELPVTAFTVGQKHIIYSTIIFCAAGIMFLLNLNHVLTRLGAMLPDPILRADIKLFVTLNFILFFPLLAAMWCVRFSHELFGLFYQKAPGLAEFFGSAAGLEGALQGSVLWLATLIIATTMTMMWKAKEAVLGGVFSLEPAPLPDEETELDAGPDEDETRIVPVSDSMDSDEDEDTTAKPVDPSLN